MRCKSNPTEVRERESLGSSLFPASVGFESSSLVVVVVVAVIVVIVI